MSATAPIRTFAASDWNEAAPTWAPEFVSHPRVLQTQDTAETVVATRMLWHPERSKVRLPTQLHIRCGAGYFAVVEPVSGIHGLGPTLESAIVDFCEALRDFDAVLDSPLAPALRELANVLDRFMAL